jgi:Helix-turn-helix domain
MTLSKETIEWQAHERERRRSGRKPGPSKPDGKSARFAPLNALADGGWLGALSPRELRVWVALYRLADSPGRARASHGTIAARCGMRREDAARTTKRLERIGLVRVLVRGRTVGQNGKRTANEYELLVPKPRPNSGAGDTIEGGE